MKSERKLARIHFNVFKCLKQDQYDTDNISITPNRNNQQ